MTYFNLYLTDDGDMEYGCQGDWDSHGNSCYQFHRQVIRWRDADAACKRKGAELATVLNQKENHFISLSLALGAYNTLFSDTIYSVYVNEKIITSNIVIKMTEQSDKSTFIIGVVCIPFFSFSTDSCFNTFDEKQCDGWAKSGECSINPLFMVKKCRKSCDHEVFCNNQCYMDTHNSTSECKDWANKGECQQNPRWMMTYCAGSCGVCASGMILESGDPQVKASQH